jgi:radical SAM superfamily enzyme YgiQ (UPF0313 family)
VPPIGIGYLITALRKNSFSVSFVDAVKDKVLPVKLLNIVGKIQPDIVGFTVFSCDIAIVKEYVNMIRIKFPNILIVLGGPHVSGVKEEIFEDFPKIDYAMCGECEVSFPILLNELKKPNKSRNFEKIRGLIYKKKEKIIVNSILFEEDLDKLEFPAWDVMIPNTYPQAPQGAVFRNWPIAPILTTRGCPYNCTYCAGKITTGQRIRKRSLSHVLEETEMLYKKYGVREFHIIDDTFTSDKERAISFCKEVIKRNLKISLTFPNGVRLNTLDEELLYWLKKAGCYSITLGIESGNQKILNDMKKGLKLDMIETKVKLINKMKIDIMSFFIVGYPTENKKTILETIAFAKKLKIKRAHFSTFLPLPGTEATIQLIKDGRLKKIDWSKMMYTDAPCPPNGMTSKELKSLQRKAFLEFYLRPHILWYMLLEIRSWIHFKSLFKRAWDYAFGR